MSEKKASDLDIFDGLVKKPRSPSDSGIQPSRPNKAPPPPSLSGKPPPAPPSSRASAPPPPLSRTGSNPRPARGSVPPAPSAPRPPGASAPPAPSAPRPPPSAPVSSSPSRSAPPPPPVQSRAPLPPPSVPVSSGPVRPPAPQQPPGLQAYSGSTGEDQTPTQLFMPGRDADRIEPRSQPSHSAPRHAPSVEIPSRPSVVPPAYAHYPKIQSVPPPSSTPLQQRLPFIVLGLVVLLVGAYFVMRPTGGSLIITVSGPGGRMVDGVEVFVDGDKKCSGSPCKIEGIGEGAHLVRATAAGYQSTADQAVSVSSGEHTTHNVSLVKASATGFKVTALGKGLLLTVDGREVGPLPQTVTDLEPGEHKIKVGGNPRYEDHEETVTVDADSLKEIGPLKLKVLKGLATFKAGPGAEGAKVLVDGRRVPTLPTTVEVPAGKTRELVAKKPGYETYRRTISFDDGVAEKTFEITMVEGESDEEPVAQPQAPRRHHSPPSRRRAPPRAAPAGQATLNMNSIPVSNVIVNGRPLGQTPKIGVSVAPGPVTVVFVHPEMGRKVQSATVTAGSTRTFMARFP